MSSEQFDEDDFILSFSTQGGLPLDNWDTQICTDFSEELPLDSQAFVSDVNSHLNSTAFQDDSKSFDSALLDEIRHLKDDDKDESFDSELLCELIEKECTLDNLKIRIKADKTFDGTHTAVRSFNRFWATTFFNPDTEKSIHQLKLKFADARDGFHALCQATHFERNIMLLHYVAGVKPANANSKSKGPKNTFITGGAKRIYLCSIARALKLYEKQNNLVHEYGRKWCWSDDVEYEQLNGILDQTTAENEFGNVQDNSSSIMSPAEFQALHEYTWQQATDMPLPFSERLKHKQHYLMQGTVAFGCLRAREDLAECRTDEFINITDLQMEFQMKRPFKSHKITSSKKVVHKPSRYIRGQKYVQIFRELLTHRPTFETKPQPSLDPESKPSPSQVSAAPTSSKRRKKTRRTKISSPPELRLWLHILPNCKESDPVYFKKEPMGERPVGRCVSTYIPALRATNPLFSDATRKFTNTSLRKYHNDSLSEAGAPLIVQQESLAQNTKAYARKASDPTNKQKVAEIVAGERKSWHSPPHPFHATKSTPTHSFSSLPLKERKFFVSTESNKENEAVASHNQPVLFTSSDNFFKLHFTNGQSTFSFEGKL